MKGVDAYQTKAKERERYIYVTVNLLLLDGCLRRVCCTRAACVCFSSRASLSSMHRIVGGHWRKVPGGHRRGPPDIIHKNVSVWPPFWLFLYNPLKASLWRIFAWGPKNCAFIPSRTRQFITLIWSIGFHELYTTNPKILLIFFIIAFSSGGPIWNPFDSMQETICIYTRPLMDDILFSSSLFHCIGDL